MRYIELVAEADTRDQLHDLITALGPEAEEAYMTLAEMLRAEGRLEGRAEGRLEGRLEGRVEGRVQTLVQTVPDSPKSESLASATASSSSRYGMTVSTGPKISSRAMRLPLSTSANRVGST